MKLHKILGVTLTASSLSQYTTYYWYIEVSDGKATTTSEKQSAKTKCSGATLSHSTSYCSGTRTVNCSTCGATGKTTYSCSGESTCGCCDGSGYHSECGSLSYTETATEYKCTAHGNHPTREVYTCGHSVTVYNCYSGGAVTETCEFRGIDPCFDIAHNGGGDCAECDGYGTYSPCSHGYSSTHDATETCYRCSGNGTLTSNCTHSTGGSSHRYCSHYNNTTLTSHTYCSHGKTSEHD